jgi:hypothetical protein
MIKLRTTCKHCRTKGFPGALSKPKLKPLTNGTQPDGMRYWIARLALSEPLREQRKFEGMPPSALDGVRNDIRAQAWSGRHAMPADPPRKPILPLRRGRVWCCHRNPIGCVHAS